jgi:hypothetical protein
VSLIVRMIGILMFAEWMSAYLEIALSWIDEYWLPGTVVMVAGVAIYSWRRSPSKALLED